MNLFSRAPESSEYPKTDAGTGNFNQYNYNLVPKNKRVTMQLAGSDPFQDEIRRIRDLAGAESEIFFAKRTTEEERTDAPMPARFFAESRMSAIVGYVPRGLEPLVIQTLARLDDAGRSTRIPAEIVTTRNGLRVVLLMGLTR
ncbi:hypothetical protein [Parafrigoribacterium soli]|uniref:hypothetical protein n=1 Tax=Parafrigoribacterium soli TaxID=3144663 RepID=UPI0032EB98DD